MLIRIVEQMMFFLGTKLFRTEWGSIHIGMRADKAPEEIMPIGFFSVFLFREHKEYKSAVETAGRRPRRSLCDHLAPIALLGIGNEAAEGAIPKIIKPQPGDCAGRELR